MISLRKVASAVLLIFIATAAMAGSGRAPLRVGDEEITGSLGNAADQDISDNRLANLKAVLSAYEKGDRNGGDAAARTLLDPAARTIAEWVAIRLAPRQVGFARIAAFLEANADWPDAPSIRRRAEEALYNDDADGRTVRAFFADRKPLTDEGKIALAHALTATGDDRGAAALVRDAYRNDPLNSDLEADIAKNFKGALNRADFKYRANRLIYDADYTGGLRAAAPAGPDVLAIAKAQAAVVRGAGDAKAALAAVPVSARGDPAYLYARIQFLRRADNPDDAAAILAKAPNNAAALIDADAWWTERRLVAREFLDEGKARLAYQIVDTAAPESDQARMEAEFHAGWIALRFIGDASTAARHFATVTAIAQRPISLARGAYWQGRAAEALGDDAAAHAFYERAARYSTTYYGQIARARIGLPDIALRAMPAISQDTRLAFNGLKAVRALTMLYQLGETDFARILIAGLAAKLPDMESLALLGNLAVAEDDAKSALGVGKIATERGMPLDAIAYPTGGIPKFQPLAQVERAVVYGIARQESEFNHAIVSRAGARGLMQLMPATARATAKASGLAFDATRLTSDPAYNAQIGSAHLGELIDKYGGSYILAFAAYNAGASNVANWIATYGDPRDPRVDPIDWVERIPFTETRNYVQRVMENVQVYRARLGGRTALLIDKDLQRGQLR